MFFGPNPSTRRNSCVALAVAINSAGNLVVAGTFNQSVSIDGTTVSTNGPGSFGFVAKLAPTGQLLWLRVIDGQQWPNRLLPGLAGDIYALVNAPNDPSASSVVRFTSTGDQSWTFSAGSAHAIAVDRAGKVAVVGSFGTPTLAIGNTLVTNRGGTAGYVAVLNTNGQPERVVPLVSEDLRWSSTSPNPVSVDEANNLIIVGRFSNDANGAALTLGGRNLDRRCESNCFFPCQHCARQHLQLASFTGRW